MNALRRKGAQGALEERARGDGSIEQGGARESAAGEGVQQKIKYRSF